MNTIKSLAIVLPLLLVSTIAVAEQVQYYPNPDYQPLYIYDPTTEKKSENPKYKPYYKYRNTELGEYITEADYMDSAGEAVIIEKNPEYKYPYIHISESKKKISFDLVKEAQVEK